MRNGIRVLLVDDEDLVRQGLVGLLTSTFALRDVATAAAARVEVGRDAPDVVVVDVFLQDGDGLQLCREIRDVHPDVACVVLTSALDESVAVAARFAGAAAFVSKQATGDELVATLEAVARGEVLLDDEVLADHLEALRRRRRDDPVLAQLSDQEQRLFELVAQGLTNREIGEVLFLSEATVRNYVGRLLSKLHLDRRTELAGLWVRLALRRDHGDGRRDTRSQA